MSLSNCAQCFPHTVTLGRYASERQQSKHSTSPQDCETLLLEEMFDQERGLCTESINYTSAES